MSKKEEKAIVRKHVGNKERDFLLIEWDSTQSDHPLFREKDPLKAPIDVEMSRIPSHEILLRSEFLKCVDYVTQHHEDDKVTQHHEDDKTFNFILSSSMQYTEIEKHVLKYMAKLKGVKTLVIFDIYIFGNSTGVHQSVNLFSTIIQSISSKLEKVVFVTLNKKKFRKTANSFKKAIEIINPHIEIDIIHSDVVHDRYWIDIDSKKGIIMGTSLNGIGKKLCLIDKLSKNDVSSILKEARKLIPSLNSHFKY